jgi:hypothetical protein
MTMLATATRQIPAIAPISRRLAPARGIGSVS